jgi:hypothetical protein
VKSLGLASLLLFLVSLAVFATSGRAAYAAARHEQVALEQRVAELEQVRRDVPLVSYGELSALTDRRDQLAETAGQRLTILVGTGALPPAEDLELVFERAGLPSLQPGSALRERLFAWVATEPRAAPVLAALLDRMRTAGIEQLEGLLPSQEGRLAPVAGVPGLGELRFELVVVSELPELLELLESLVPGRGEPVLTTRGASLRRIEPSLWRSAPEHLTSPPVRMRVDVSALFGIASDGGRS